MTFSEAVTTVTRNKIVPDVFDTVTKGTPGLMTFLRTAKEWKSGTKYDFPIKYQDSTTGGVTGIADQLSTARENVRTLASFEVKMATKNVVVANIETTLNKGDEQVVDLLSTEFDSQAQSLMNVMAQQLYNGNGTGNEWDSLDNAADDGTNFNTYGNLSRATYSSFEGYYIASVGSLSLSKLATAHDAVSIGVETPTMMLTTKALWSVYEALITPTLSHNANVTGYPRMNEFGGVSGRDGFGGGQGFVYLDFRGTAFVKDEQMPSGEIFLTNTKFFGMKGVNIDGMSTLNFKKSSSAVPMGVPGNVPSTRGFNFRQMMEPVDQLAKVGHLVYAGNFISENPRLQGHMEGVTA